MAHITPIRPRVTDVQGKELWVHPWSSEPSKPLVQLYIPELQHQSLHLEPGQAKLLLEQLTKAIEELEPAGALLEVSA